MARLDRATQRSRVRAANGLYVHLGGPLLRAMTSDVNETVYWLLLNPQKIASGFTGEPLPPSTGNGAHVIRNS